ncbi:glutaminase A [Rhodococcus cerastii]|uniref:glutaminase A n=1 Tax=Rhodococcus erythropolis TaxID=1833 RepID=UPI00406BD97B|nr:glutaminase A [Rhodococcus cerastii]
MTDSDYKATLERAHTTTKGMTEGKNANYIPFLASVDPSLFGLAIVTVAGDVYESGDSRYEFALESISKVFTMALALEDIGQEVFHRKVGADPTGLPFNSVMALEMHDDMPLTPLVNAGAMSSTSVLTAKDSDERWARILDVQSRFAGRKIELSDEVNNSEQSTNAHNRAIAWLLYSGGAMYADPMEVCEVYTRQCSTLVNTVDLAVMGATLAAGGVNPVTGKRVVTAANVPHMLAEMVMEGLYTKSGDWAYNVGLPGKSGVGGGLVAVAPGKLAIAGFSPPLDAAGNSVRAQAAIAQIADELKLGLYRVPGLG